MRIGISMSSAEDGGRGDAFRMFQTSLTAIVDEGARREEFPRTSARDLTP